jgi:itaconate CoA-transferase
MLESMTEWMGFPMYYAFDGAAPPPRAGASHATIYPYGPFPTGDGKTVMLGLQNEREWQVFCNQVLQQPALASDARFSSNARRASARAELQQIIDTAFASLSAEQLTGKLDAAQIANAHVNTMADVWSHPQLAARQRWVEVDTPVGLVAALLPPGLGDAAHARMDAIPALGQHTEAILRELGMSAAEVTQLRAESAI